MAGKPETQKRYTALVARFAKLAPLCKSTGDKLVKFSNALDEAGRKRDQTTAQLQTKAVTVEYGRIEDLQKQVDSAIKELELIEKDDDFVVAENKKLVVLSKALDRLSVDLRTHLSVADAALANARKAAETLRKDSQRGQQAMVSAREAAQKMRDYVLAAGKAIDLRLKVARDASQQRDREAFKKSFQAAESALAEVKRTFASFSKNHSDRCDVLSKEWIPFIAELPVLDEARDAAGAAADEVKRIEREVAKVAPLSPPPVDFVKAAKVLGIDKDIQKVRKALDGAAEDVRDQLNDLARSCGMHKSGKQLYEDLRKARIL